MNVEIKFTLQSSKTEGVRVYALGVSCLFCPDGFPEISECAVIKNKLMTKQLNDNLTPY